MKNILIGFALILNASQAFATAQFDWMKFAKMINVGGDYSVMVSTIQFDDRFMALEFCKSLSKSMDVELELADFQTVMNLSIYGKTPVPQLLFQSTAEGELKYGIVAWDNQRPLDKVIQNGKKHKDTNIMIRYRGTHDVLQTSIAQESTRGEFTFQNDSPIVKLPAVCQSVK